MRLSQKTRQQAGGYTMIELLVVITIIIIIAGLLLAALGKARDKGPLVQTKAEMAEIGKAVENLKATYNVPYIPTALILCNDYNAAAMNPGWGPAANDSRQYLSRLWPKMNPAVAIPAGQAIGLDGNQVLLFLLGGVGPGDSRFGAGYNGTRSGFLNSPTNPFNINSGVAYSPPSGERAKGPFYDFKQERIDTNSHYLDFYGMPYYYFSSRHGNDYNYFGIYQPVLNSGNNPYGFTNDGGYGGIPPGTTLPNGTVVSGGIAPMRPFGGLDGKYIHSNSFQIISAGKNNQPGPGGANFDSGVGAYSPGGLGGDDLSNFFGTMLGGSN